MRTGRPKDILSLTTEENTKLTMLARRPKTDQRTALRARIVLECATGVANGQVARRLGVTAGTVGKWRQRFVARRLAGWGDAPRPGQPRKLTDATVEAVVTRTLESRPKGATHWSTRSMAKASGLTQRAFAEREGIKFSTFTAWVQGRRLAGRRGRKVRFTEVPLMAPAPVMVGLAVQLPDGVVVRGTNASEVAALVRALRN
jgi:transposase